MPNPNVVIMTRKPTTVEQQFSIPAQNALPLVPLATRVECTKFGMQHMNKKKKMTVGICMLRTVASEMGRTHGVAGGAGGDGGAGGGAGGAGGDGGAGGGAGGAGGDGGDTGGGGGAGGDGGDVGGSGGAGGDAGEGGGEAGGSCAAAAARSSATVKKRMVSTRTRSSAEFIFSFL